MSGSWKPALTVQPEEGRTYVDDSVHLRNTTREAQVLERADRLEVDMLREAIDVVVAELDFVAVPVCMAGSESFGRLQEALQERIVDVGQRRAVVEGGRDQLQGGQDILQEARVGKLAAVQ